MHKMKYSVIVTVYNDDQFLPSCFDSILAQTIKPEEIIVVDDNSTDNSGKIIDQYNFRKIFSSEPKHEQRWLNRVRAFKLGLNSIEKPTDLLLKVDSDIIIPDNYVEILISHFENDSKLAAISGVQKQDRFHPLPRNGAIMYKQEALSNPSDLREVYAWDRWTLLWLQEREYHVKVDKSLVYIELRDSILSKKEAYRTGIVRRREHYPIRGVLIQALLQGGLKSLYFLYGYITGAGPARHSQEFIKEYAKKEEKERMKYITKRLEAKK